MVGINAYDFGSDHLADPHFLACQALFKQRCKIFTRTSLGNTIHYLQSKTLKFPFSRGWLIKRRKPGQLTTTVLSRHSGPLFQPPPQLSTSRWYPVNRHRRSSAAALSHVRCRVRHGAEYPAKGRP